jgi:hypothetical protein
VLDLPLRLREFVIEPGKHQIVGFWVVDLVSRALRWLSMFAAQDYVWCQWPTSVRASKPTKATLAPNLAYILCECSATQGCGTRDQHVYHKAFLTCVVTYAWFRPNDIV